MGRSPWWFGEHYSFLMSDRGHVNLHGLARRHTLDLVETLRLTLDVTHRPIKLHAQGLVHNYLHTEHVVLRVEPLGSGERRVEQARVAASLVTFV